MFCRDLHLTLKFSGPLQKDLFRKEGNPLSEYNLPSPQLQGGEEDETRVRR